VAFCRRRKTLCLVSVQQEKREQFFGQIAGNQKCVRLCSARFWQANSLWLIINFWLVLRANLSPQDEFPRRVGPKECLSLGRSDAHRGPVCIPD